MPVLLVVCDTKREVLRERLCAVIEAYGDVLALSESSYLLDTHRLPDDLQEALSKKIAFDGSEALLVLAVTQPYRGRIPPKVKQWYETIKRKRLTDCAPRSASPQDQYNDPQKHAEGYRSPGDTRR